jgi:rhodanese-related sulfurtransferase
MEEDSRTTERPRESQATGTAPNGETTSPEQARQMLGSNEASAIDIRGDEQWRDGRLPGAREAVSLTGGMEAWRSDDMPMQPSRDPEEGAAI